MKRSLEEARRLIEDDKTMAEFTLTLEGNELHMSKGDECFVRLIPEEESGLWRIEYFHNEKRWERVDFTGSLAACLELLAESPHYLYWDR